MNLLFGITALLATSVIAAKYAPGQDCRTNKGCDENCIGSKWSVVIEAGDARMVCDPSTVDSTRYAEALCKGADQTTNQSICKNMKGKFCNYYCYLTTSASKEDEMTTSYQKLCLASGATNSGDPYAGPRVNVYPTKELALKLSNGKCDASVFS